jgi:hypothetical protein
MINRLFLIIILATAAITTSSLWAIPTGSNNAYGQSSAAVAASHTTANTQAPAEHESLMVSTHIPLTGQLSKGDYIHLMDFTPFKVNTEGHSHIAMKVPCDSNGNPKVTIIAGVAPDFKTVKMEGAGPIMTGTLDGKSIPLSIKGVSCLYHGDIPASTTDIALANTSGNVLSFTNGGYGVTITAHAEVSGEGEHGMAMSGGSHQPS